MKRYYYSTGSDNFGPFTLEELRSKEISRTTKIWYDGLGQDWKEAGSLPELIDIFSPMPSPIVSSSSNPDLLDDTSIQRPPKNWLTESILATLFCCMPFGIAGIVNASKVESLYYSGNLQAAHQASADAKKWTMISFWIGIVVLLLYIIVSIAAGTM